MLHDELYRIVATHEQLVRSFFTRKVHDIEDIEDLVQDVLCAVLESYKRYRGKSSITTWIYGICRNVLYSYYYDKKQSGNLIRRLQNRGSPDTPPNPFYLHWASERLKPAQKKLFNDFYRDAMPIRVIASQLGVPEGTVKYQLYRLRQDLKRMFDRDGG